VGRSFILLSAGVTKTPRSTRIQRDWWPIYDILKLSLYIYVFFNEHTFRLCSLDNFGHILLWSSLFWTVLVIDIIVRAFFSVFAFGSHLFGVVVGHRLFAPMCLLQTLAKAFQDSRWFKRRDWDFPRYPALINLLLAVELNLKFFFYYFS
jgi:hypothetical protein